MKKKEKLDENGEPIEDTEVDMDIVVGGEIGEKAETDYDSMDNDVSEV